METKKKVIRNQDKFRNELLKIYDGKCVITGSIKALEEAHIIPYAECKHFEICNGLILKNDIHRMYDSYELTINPDTLKIEMFGDILNDDYFKLLNGKQIILPKPYEDKIKKNLKVMYDRFCEKNNLCLSN